MNFEYLDNLVVNWVSSFAFLKKSIPPPLKNNESQMDRYHNSKSVSFSAEFEK